jgi:two-component sensor histidine kinase
VKFEITGSAGDIGSPEATALAVVLTELLQNVMDHAYPAGTLVAGEGGLVRIALSHDPDVLLVVVRDDGIGPAEGVDAGTGTSLGLSIVRGLLGDLQGTIDFGSAGGPPGRAGTQVELRIPLRPET